METTTGRELATLRNLAAVSEPTCSPPRSPARRTIPKAIHEIVGELKVRFQHGSGGDAEGFRARAALLAEDLADVPAALLRTAAATWVREQPFMPTAADLTRLMREELGRRDRQAEPINPPPGFDAAEAFASTRNAALASDPTARQDIEWVAINGQAQLRYKAETRFLHYDRHDPDRVAPDEVDHVNSGLRFVGAEFRFNRNGYPIAADRLSEPAKASA